MMKTAAVALLLILATPAAPAAQPYTLELELTAANAFPLLSRFGSVSLQVFPGGVRADSAVLDAFSKNGSDEAVILSPLSRIYSEVAIRDVGSMLRKLVDRESREIAGTAEFPLAPEVAVGNVKGVPAKRYRVMLGPEAWIDVWTTEKIGRNRQLHRLQQQFLSAISPGVAATASKIPGTPIYVELNTTRFRKTPVLRLKGLKNDADGESDALSVGRLYVRAPLIDSLF